MSLSLVLLKQYYHPSLKLCYEHMTRGPCEQGLLFTYNPSKDSTQCICSPELLNYSPEHGECFELGSKGTCGKGQIFVFNAELKESRCECKEKYVYWQKTDSCFREFTPGPCRNSHFIIKDLKGNGICSKNPCPKTDLFFPNSKDNSEGKCHKVGSKGPCPKGELVIFETYSGKSFRGNCGCSVGYNQNYWPEDQLCYEWYSQGNTSIEKRGNQVSKPFFDFIIWGFYYKSKYMSCFIRFKVIYSGVDPHPPQPFP